MSTKKKSTRVKADDLEIDVTSASAEQRYVKRFGKRPEITLYGNYVVPNVGGDKEQTFYGVGPLGTTLEIFQRALRLRISVNIRPK